MQLQIIQSKIYQVRGVNVMLDYDLAELYETETKYLKRAVKRNPDRFPADFMFELKKEEWDSLRCQIGTSNKTNEKRGGRRYLPYCFTEQGVAMLASILNSQKSYTGEYINCKSIRFCPSIRPYA